MNCRFYPTLNGECHLGHLLIALLNWQRAKDQGGSFIVRSEVRIQYLNRLTTAGQLEQWHNSFVQAFEFAGLDGDFKPFLTDARWVEDRLREFENLHGNDVDNRLYPLSNLSHGFHPYSPTWCMERVLLDHRYSVNEVIRGIDLISEMALYVHFCKQIKVPIPKMVFCSLVSIKTKEGIQLVSKTNGNGLISDLIGKGMSKEQLIEVMKRDCLKDPKEGFRIQNVRERIILDMTGQ